MAHIDASNSPIVVDRETDNKGKTSIKYLKERFEAIWERSTTFGWTEVNIFVRTGRGDEAETTGDYEVTLRPGEFYEAGVFEDGHGPLSTDPIRLAFIKVYCLWKKPEVRHFITDQNRSTGGTWHFHQVHTNVPTDIVTIGATRTAPFVDAAGIPHIKGADGGPTVPLMTSNNHLVEINPLYAGNRYFFVVVVTDNFGNWEAYQEEFTTLRRKITVEFPTIHIFNDGDPGSHGEGEFWFRVQKGPFNQPEVIQDFHLPEQDIDDWSETDRPYSVGFAHLGAFEIVEPRKESVGVISWGVEHDGFLEADEGASSLGVFLPIPAGRFVENVNNSTLKMDCPVSTTGDDFHYGVDVRWSVEYGV
jgi:hypothetical protein